MLILAAVSVGIGLTFGGLVNILARFIGEEEAFLYEGGVSSYVINYALLLFNFAPVGIAAIAFAQVVIVFFRFYKSVATDEAYLTFTLPATPAQQYFARFLGIIAWLFFIAFCALVSGLILLVLSTMGVNEALRGYFSISLRDILEIFNPDALLIMFEAVLLAIVWMAASGAEIMLAILIGGRIAKKYKAGASIGIIVLFSHIQSVVMAIIISTCAIFFSGIQLYWETAMHLMLWIMISLAAIIGGLCVCFGYSTMKKVNLT